jgi:hypothetical protein
MTYGVSALASESWPAVLGGMRGLIVYNMSLGGYGPIQYLYLLETLAINLRPKIVVVGFYFGNDLMDVYNTVRYNEKWNRYGSLGDSKLEGPAFIFPRQPGKFLGGLRNWLSRNSVLYVLATQLPAFDFIRQQETARRMVGESENLIEYRDDKHHVLFDLSPRHRFLDMADPRIRDAFDITKRIMFDMRQFSEKEGIRLIVALIPTKERVYGKLLEKSGDLRKRLPLMHALQEEDVVRDMISEYLHEIDIEFVDLLPALQGGIGDRDLYPMTDSHPNSLGYRVIADTISSYLDRHPPVSAVLQ